MVVMAHEDAMELIRMEYHELPGLALTFWQAKRLWNLSDELCELALRSLVRDGFLMVTSSGTFVHGPQSRVSIDASAAFGEVLSPGNSCADPSSTQKFAAGDDAAVVGAQE
jgi:hypothetical protein